MRSSGWILNTVTVFGKRDFQRSDKGIMRPVGLSPFKRRKRYQGCIKEEKRGHHKRAAACKARSASGEAKPAKPLTMDCRAPEL